MDRQNFNIMQAITIEALIVIDVHALDVLELLQKNEISEINAFEWISQLRYYLQDSEQPASKKALQQAEKFLA